MESLFIGQLLNANLILCAQTRGQRGHLRGWCCDPCACGGRRRLINTVFLQPFQDSERLLICVDCQRPSCLAPLPVDLEVLSFIMPDPPWAGRSSCPWRQPTCMYSMSFLTYTLGLLQQLVLFICIFLNKKDERPLLTDCWESRHIPSIPDSCRR